MCQANFIGTKLYISFVRGCFFFWHNIIDPIKKKNLTKTDQHFVYRYTYYNEVDSH